MLTVGMFYCSSRNECHCGKTWILRGLTYWNTCNAIVNDMMLMSCDSETVVGLFCQELQKSIDVHHFFLTVTGVYRFSLARNNYLPISQSQSLSRTRSRFRFRFRSSIVGRHNTTLSCLRALVLVE